MEDKIWGNSALPQDKSDYVLMEIYKVGKKQTTVTPGQKVLVSEQLMQDIKIRDQGIINDYKKINNSDSIFAICSS